MGNWLKKAYLAHAAPQLLHRDEIVYLLDRGALGSFEGHASLRPYNVTVEAAPQRGPQGSQGPSVLGRRRRRSRASSR